MQIDEAHIGLQKYLRGCVIREVWVFRSIDPVAKECLIEHVRARNAGELYKIDITRRIKKRCQEPIPFQVAYFAIHRYIHNDYAFIAFALFGSHPNSDLNDYYSKYYYHLCRYI